MSIAFFGNDCVFFVTTAVLLRLTTQQGPVPRAVTRGVANYFNEEGTPPVLFSRSHTLRVF